MEFGKAYYYTNVQELYNNTKIDGQKVVGIRLLIINLCYNIDEAYGYTPEDGFKEATPQITSFKEILKFPNLEPRDVVMSTAGVVGPSSLIDFSNSGLRDARKNGVRFVTLHYLGPLNTTVSLCFFALGFYDTSLYFSDKILLLLDYSSFNPSDNNYYAVIVQSPDKSRSEIERIMRAYKYNIDVFHEIIQNYGTFYKLEDLPILARDYM